MPRVWGGDERDDRERERDNYFGDVTYEVWRSGGNPDRVDRDRVSEDERDGLSVEQSARHFMPRRPEPEPEQYPDEQYPDEPISDEQEPAP